MTTSSESARENPRALRHAALGLLVVLAVNAPSFNGDDAAFFNYLNNVSDPHLLYFYAGYVPLLPELFSYSLRPLPLAYQAAAYRLLPLIAILLLYRELTRLFRTRWNGNEAWLLAFSLVLLLRCLEPELFANLSHAQWSAVMAATIYVVRPRAAHEQPSVFGLVAVWLAAASTPVGVLVGAVLLYQWRIRPRGARRAQPLAAGLLIVGWHLFVSVTAPYAIVQSPKIDVIAATLMAGFRPNKLATLVAVGAGVALIAAVVIEWRGERRQASPVWPLAFIGLASLPGYLLTDRFLLLEGFEPRFTIPVAVCALAGGVMSIARLSHGVLRPQAVGLLPGAALALVGVVQYAHLRGPLETALMKYRFLEVAAEFRDACGDGDAMVYEFTAESPVVLCEAGQLTAPFHEVTHVPPSLGVRSTPRGLPPGVHIPEPVF